jgi:hypothetical protein
MRLITVALAVLLASSLAAQQVISPVNGKANLAAAQMGDIVFDASDQTFWGCKKAGAPPLPGDWLPLSATGQQLTDWTPFTPSILSVGAGNIPPEPGTGGHTIALYRFVGNTMELSITHTQTIAGKPGNGTYKFVLPVNRKVHSALLPGQIPGAPILGHGAVAEGQQIPKSPAVVFPIADDGLALMWLSPHPTIPANDAFVQVGFGSHHLGNSQIAYSFQAVVPLEPEVPARAVAPKKRADKKN